MTLKEIWKEFADKAAVAANDCWLQIKKVWKSTWEVFKVALIDFVKAVFAWIWSILSGVVLVAIDALKIIFAALVAAVKSTLGVAYDKVIEWINKI